MKKLINKIIYSERGNILILVMFISLCCIIIVETIMYVTFNQFTYSQSYKKSSNISYLAESGAEKAVSYMNDIVSKNISQIINSTSQDIINNISTLNTDNIRLKDNIFIYEGENSDGNYTINNKEFKKVLKENIYNTIGNSFSFSYTTNLEDYQYKVEVFINKDIQQLDKDITYIVTSTCYNINNSSKYTVKGKITLYDDMDLQTIFLEKYKWKDKSKPNLLSNAIISKGDIVLKSKAELNVYKSDVIVGGTISEYCVETDKYGGIYALNGSKINIENNVYISSNLHTKRTYSKDNIEILGENKSEINIHGDVIANTISIEDNFLSQLDDTFYTYINYSPYNVNTMSIGHSINIGGDVYTRNDLIISKYVMDCNINIKGNFFGINSYGYLYNGLPDPNKSSCVINNSMGNSSITIGKAAFVNGTAFINFDNSIGFKELAESVGKPYDDVYEYYIENPSRLDKGNDWFNKFENSNSVENSSITIEDFEHSMARGYISANGKSLRKETSSYNIISNLDRLDGFFKGKIDNKKFNPYDLKQINSKWEFDNINGVNVLDIIFQEGINGYLNKKLGILYETRTGSILNDFDTENNLKYSYGTDLNKYNTIMIIDHEKYGDNEVEIDINNFYYDGKPIPSAIVDIRTNGKIILKSGENNKFIGIIYSNGKIEIENIININGIIIAGNKYEGVVDVGKLENGDYAGILIKDNAKLNIEYDIFPILNIRAEDYKLKRKLYDYLGITNYNILKYTSKISEIENALKYLNIKSSSDIITNVDNLFKFELNNLKYIP